MYVGHECVCGLVVHVVGVFANRHLCIEVVGEVMV